MKSVIREGLWGQRPEVNEETSHVDISGGEECSRQRAQHVQRLRSLREHVTVENCKKVDVAGAKVMELVVRNEGGEVLRDHVRKSPVLQAHKCGLCAEGIWGGSYPIRLCVEGRAGGRQETGVWR